MKLLTDIKGNAGFDEWFDSKKAKQITKALNDIGFDIEIEEADYEFKDYPILRKKGTYATIPNSPKNIAIMLLNADLEDDVILKKLGVERESSYIITPRIRMLQGEYVKWQKIDHNKEWKNEEERIMAFAGYFEKKKTKRIDVGDKVIINISRNKGVIKSYNKEKKQYLIETKDGTGYYNKTEFKAR